MSYGEWKSRGKNWAHLEVDSPWNWTFDKWESQNVFDAREKANRSFRSLELKWEKFNLWDIESINWESNPTVAKFIAYQAGVKGRIIVRIENGCHEEWFAFDRVHYHSSTEDFAQRRLKRHRDAFKFLKIEPTEDNNPELDLKNELERLFKAYENSPVSTFKPTIWHSWVEAKNKNAAQSRKEKEEDVLVLKGHPIW
jgi:hypothetical protein